MTKPRVPETNHTISGRAYAEAYDRMQAALREKGWLETGDLLLNGIVSGCALEVGSGPGYLGLEWLLQTRDTRLVGLDISPDMVAIARNHARELGLADRAEHLLGSAEAYPLRTMPSTRSLPAARCMSGSIQVRSSPSFGGS